MNLNHLDDDSDQSDFPDVLGEDNDVHLNHYRVPKLSSYGYGLSNPPRTKGYREQVKCSNEGKIMTLAELAAQKVACHLPFGLVEHYEPPVPEPMQCRIAFWSFPQDEEDVKLYTCLANGNAEYFYRAEELINQNAVRDILQVGFHLSANVQFMSESESLEFFRVAVTFDRRRITSCSCTCMTATFWCQHVVAACLQRIRNPQEVKIRAPVSESLQRLEKNQLQKFAQYLINELPQQILPAAQKLLDELLSGDEASINLNPGAPDPTAGATINEHTSWCLDYTHLSLDIHRILLKQCTAQPTVCSDIQSLHVTAPPATTEYQQLLRPIRGREPEGIWNLISIVGEMMKRRDPNLFLLLEIMTDEVMKFDKIVTWWFETKVSMHAGSSIHLAPNKNSQYTSQYSCSNFCDEIIHLWRLAALNPSASQAERQDLSTKFFNWHLAILKKHCSIAESNSLSLAASGLSQYTSKNLLELFPGFKAAMEGCLVDWSDWDEKRSRLMLQDAPDMSWDTNILAKKRKHRKKPSKQNSTHKTEGNSEVAEHDTTADKETTASQNQENSAPLESYIDQGLNDQQEQEFDVALNGHQPCREILPNQDRERFDDQPNQGSVTPRGEPMRERNMQIRLEDDLRVYFMDRQHDNPPLENDCESLEDLIRINRRRLNDPIEVWYAKTEGLHAHGHLEEARNLARQLALAILNLTNYPSNRQLYSMARRRKRRGNLDNQRSIVASETLAKINFLCSVLFDDPKNHSLIFKLAMFGVELRRAPACTRPMEVKLISQKQELVAFLKNITLHESEFEIIRRKAELMRDRVNDRQTDPLTTLMLGSYVFEALVLSRDAKHPKDANLGFQCALCALGVKINILEADHPLLCEGIRRQRGELALSLITHHKDDQEKLDAILKKLLDKDLIKAKPANLRSPTMPTAHTSSATTIFPSINNATNANPNAKKVTSQQDLNQPSEAAAHFMFELAKTVFDKAGGNSNAAHIFRPQVVSQNGSRGIHRKLHMCSLRIALHALGLHNRTSPSWMQRTYNGRAVFVHDQALELGLPGIKFLCENWEGYLTPVEAAAIADKAGCSNDAETKRIAAEMAKSCLRYANFLDYNAVSRALAQCKEQTVEMIEEACSEIEQIAENDSVCADVLFATARAWHSLYLELITNERHCANGNLYQLTSAGHPDNGAGDWLASSGQPFVERNQQTGDVSNQPMWNVYDRSEFIMTSDTPVNKNFEYVRAAFRVGIKALDSMKLSLHVGSKHNPKKLDEILWLLGISKSLGRDCLYKFSQSIVRNITDPYMLHLIILEIIKFFETIKLPPEHMDHEDILEPIYEKCLDKCMKQTKDLLKHIPYDIKNSIETILEVVQTLTILKKSMTTAQYYWEILKSIENKLEKRNNRRSKMCINLSERREWLRNFALDLKYCACEECWMGRGKELRGKFRSLYQPN